MPAPPQIRTDDPGPGHHPRTPGVWRAALAGLCALLVGIGLGRFAYTPLSPALVDAGWLDPGQAAYLGAANLAGYLLGALLARPLADRASAPAVLRSMMVLTTASFLASAAPLSFAWLCAWRLAAGVAGGVLMVLAAATVLPLVRPKRRGLAGGFMVTGVGLGIVASGTVIPMALEQGVSQAWGVLGVLSLILTAVAWKGWPRASPRGGRPRGAEILGKRRSLDGAVRTLLVAYGLVAAGLVPHMLYLADFVARGLAMGVDAGAFHWVLFGLGAAAGALLPGLVADRIGFRTALRTALALEAVCVAWLAVSADSMALVASSILVGAFVPGVVPLVLGRLYELLPHDPGGRAKAWSAATVVFALGQAGAAYGCSFLFTETGRYDVLFAAGGAAMVSALVLELGAGLGSRRRRPVPRRTRRGGTQCPSTQS